MYIQKVHVREEDAEYNIRVTGLGCITSGKVAPSFDPGVVVLVTYWNRAQWKSNCSDNLSNEDMFEYN